jgi:AcrR family transcriptional regulator
MSQLLERRRRRTRRHIADHAARLVAGQGLSATTVEQIAEAAEVGRATFFRYFGTKELAVAEGFARDNLQAISDALARQPAELSACDAVRAAYVELAHGFQERRDDVRRQAELARSSPALQAWTLLLHADYEVAIARLVAPRFTDLGPGDLRPRLVGATTMAVVRLAVDEWLASGATADLPAIIATGLDQVAIP